ncbi:Na/Pi cotransporter family protein [bacterium]|nr:Na/Pi cotransporter family protein [bacterium]
MMTTDIAIQIFFGVIGGLGLFLFGMKQMSEGMQAIAGERLRQLISKVTDNRLTACGVGVAVTGLVQSSSITTVMVVGMVNATLMTLKQAVGVIMGTNIGTTVTAWLIALHIADYGLPLLGIAALTYLFAKSRNVQYIAMIVLGLGMVFFGLELMKDGLKPLRSLPAFISMMSAFNPATFFGLIQCVFVGAFLTAVVQSSSATVAITITLAATQVITYETAVALVLGENIGTTITAFLSSLGASTNARRAAIAHVLFNVTGVTLMLPLFKVYVAFLTATFPETIPVATRIAFAHSFFNIFVVMILLPFMGPFTRMVTLLVPAKKTREKRHLTYLDIRMFDTPALAIQQSYQEIVNMSNGVKKMMDWFREVFTASPPDEQLKQKIFHREKICDIVQKEIVEFISHIMTGVISQNATDETRKQLRITDEYESISDYIVTLLKLRCRMQNEGLAFADTGVQEMLQVHDAVTEFLLFVQHGVRNKDAEILPKAVTKAESLKHMVKNIQSNHLSRLEKEKVTPIASLVFMDMLNAYRRIKDHAFNIAEALAGEK